MADRSPGHTRVIGASGTRRLRRSSVVASGVTTPWASIEDRKHRSPWVPRSAAREPRLGSPHERRVTLVEGPEITAAEAVIDNGSFGTLTIRFETGRLAKQAAGSATVYLDGESMLLSTTAAGKNPKDQFDFFPLTVDVEERMYAAGRIPGSFFRREGRPSTDAVLTCRLIDRPLRPSFVKGLRNEIQVVITVLSLNPDDLYDVVAINGASLSTQLSGLPFSGPIGGGPVAPIEGAGGALPRDRGLQPAGFPMVLPGRAGTR